MSGEGDPAKLPTGGEGFRPVDEMRLRPTRPPVTRLSRKVLIGLGSVAAAGIATALFLALRPQSHNAPSELLASVDHPAPEGLASLPRDYTGLPKPVPQLGPPLPGDLGRPILKAGVAAPAIGGNEPIGPDQQRANQELEAARTSHLFAQTAQAAPSNAPSPNANGTPVIEAIDSQQQDRHVAFLNGLVDHRTTSPDHLQASAGRFVIQAGDVIPAALMTGLRSDLPGQVTAQVTQDVYDSLTGRSLLIPQGAKLIGQYDAQIAFGQSRILLAWTRLILPNGRSIVLERQPGADAEGYAGLQDQVDNHWGMLFKAAMLSTLLSVGAEAGTGTGNNQNSLVQALRQGSSQSFSQIGEQVVGRMLNVQPTITIRPGFPVRVMVTHDLVLAPYQG